MPIYADMDSNQYQTTYNWSNHSMQSNSHEQPTNNDDYITDDEEEVVYELDEHALACLPERLQESMRYVHLERLQRVRRRNPSFQYRRAGYPQNDRPQNNHAERWLENVVTRLMEAQAMQRAGYQYHSMGQSADALPQQIGWSSYQGHAVQPPYAYNTITDQEQLYPRVTDTDLTRFQEDIEDDIEVEYESSPAQEGFVEPTEDLYQPPCRNMTWYGDEMPEKKPNGSKPGRRRSSILEMRGRFQKKIGKMSRFFKRFSIA